MSRTDLIAAAACTTEQISATFEDVRCVVLLEAAGEIYLATSFENASAMRGVLASAVAQSVLDEGVPANDLGAQVARDYNAFAASNPHCQGK